MTERLPSIELIKRAVAEHFGTTIAAIEGPSRKHPLVHQRQIAHYLALKRSKHSKKRIGRCFNRDHVTMRWSRYQVGQRLYRDEQMMADIAAIEAIIETAQRVLERKAWYANGTDHAHCPKDCEHPQPFTSEGELYCGRCWFRDGEMTKMIACTPATVAA
jgi:hypothetical protein